MSSFTSGILDSSLALASHIHLITMIILTYLTLHMYWALCQVPNISLSEQFYELRVVMIPILQLEQPCAEKLVSLCQKTHKYNSWCSNPCHLT